MKIVKVVLLLAVLLVGLVVGLGFFIFSQVDNLAKAGIEKGGSYAMGVETTVDSVDVSLLSGEFAMTGLTVANPVGYSRPNFLGLGHGDVKVDPGSVNQDIIRVPTLNLSDVELNLLKQDGKSNYQVILDNLKRFESGGNTEPDPDAEGQGYIIERIEIKNIDVYAALAPIGGDLTAVPIKLDEIILTDVGNPSGVKMGELMNIIVKALLSAVINKAGDLPGDIVGELTNGLAGLESLGDLGIGVVADGAAVIGELGDEAAAALEGATEVGEKAVEEAGKAVDDITKGIGNLFGGDDDN